MPTARGTANVVAALSPQRRRVLDVLADTPTSVAAVADRLELHVNTAREHLDGLVQAGLAKRSRLAPSGRGRPGWGYAAEPASSTTLAGEYAALAGVLADFVLEQSHDVAGDMGRLGRGWGRRLMAGRVAGERATGPVSAAEADASVLDLMDDLGFAPEVSPEAIRLRQCPMLDVARAQPDVVCAVHRGLVEGALEERGVAPDGVRLDAFAAPGACLLHLHQS